MKQGVLLIIGVLAVAVSIGQGCSDAGFCSLGALKGVHTRATEKHRIDIGANTGWGEENTFTFNPYLQYTRNLSNRFSVSGKVTATYASGFLGNRFGAGDFYGFATFKVNKDSSVHNWRALAGIKIPFTSSNQKNSRGGALPLDYQSSLGTYDVILGINYTVNKYLELSTGLQVPVIHNNRNTFFPEEYNDTRAQSFAPTNYFRRKSDILLRAGYYFNMGKNFVIKPGLLTIYHTGNDSYEDRFGKRAVINGSEGFTLNGTVTITKQFNNKTSLELIAATPFIVRDVRADGLTRSLAVNLQYSIALQ